MYCSWSESVCVCVRAHVSEVGGSKCPRGRDVALQAKWELTLKRSINGSNQYTTKRKPIVLHRAPRQGEEKNRAVTSNAYMYEKPDGNDGVLQIVVFTRQ